MSNNTVYYAVGDVHGMADKLAFLHQMIIDDIDQRLITRAVIVHLGDYVDRGPDSHGVIHQIMTLEVDAAEDDRVDIVSLMGNHERMMVDALAGRGRVARDLWQTNGGEATVRSYRAAGVPASKMVDHAHLHWVAGLPTLYYDRSRNIAFVHAGIDPLQFPDCTEETRLWTRSAMFTDENNWPNRDVLADLTVVHGHTPTEDGMPDIGPRRINVDTAAVYGGPLTAAVLAPSQETRFLRV